MVKTVQQQLPEKIYSTIFIADATAAAHFNFVQRMISLLVQIFVLCFNDGSILA